MNSGQIFRMERLDGETFSVRAAFRYLEIREKGGEFEFSCSEEEFFDFWYDYFDLGTDYRGMKRKIDPGSGFLLAAADYGGGIRILRQDLWEMLISFIISQQKQISNIRACVERLCEKFGQHYIDERHEWYGFPSPQQIASGGLDGLKDLGLGYRDKYIYGTARMICEDGTLLGKISQLGYEEARRALQQFPGVGVKVADCVCLFSLAFKDAFPIDVHVKDILAREFNKTGKPKDELTDRDYREIADREFRQYEGFRGIVQQWMFAYELANVRSERRKQ